MNNVFIGTSGWYYKSWHRQFYPRNVPKSKQLAYYASQLPTVEVNSSFYRLLTESTVTDWRDQVPDDFVFALKGSRFITHMKKLPDVETGLKRYFASIEGFGKKLGPILWQLPPQLKKDVGRLEDFLDQLPKGNSYAVEFREPGWWCKETFAALERRNVALVWLSSQTMPMDFRTTADFVYGRFHGLEGGVSHDYTEAELKPWAAAARRQVKAGRRVYLYFNNDGNSRAPWNAELLAQLITKHPGPKIGRRVAFG